MPRAGTSAGGRAAGWAAPPSSTSSWSCYGVAFAAWMPRGVVASGAADLVLPLEGVASALTALVMVPGAVGLLGPPRLAAAA